jgi:3'-phosphoadenosine 5'-phosphosulfate sulfotransferase (PAPS reductase)/FAD synthetase
MNLDDYDTVIVAFSGGKDSTACLLHLLDLGVPKEKIELWHHLIDGEPGSEPFMDWPMTEDYCRRFAAEFDIPLYFSWRNGGFEREMLRDNQPTAPISWEQPDGTVGTAGGGGHGTRLKFPQVSNDLRVRWCSAYLKIDVMRTAINNQERFLDSKTLVITGERAQESKNREGYKEFEDYRSNAPTKGRTVHQWRPIHSWDEAMVWSIIERHRVNPHPAYWLGWGRLSCMTCIFGSADQWASANHLYPDMVKRIADYETQFGVTIKRDRPVGELVASGTRYHASKILPEDYPIIDDEWELPAGALSGNNAGPT